MNNLPLFTEAAVIKSKKSRRTTSGRFLLPLLGSLACLLALASVSASDFVKFPQGPAAWSVAVSQAEAPVPDPGKPDSRPVMLQQVDARQDGQTRAFTVRHSDGASREIWAIPGLAQVLTEDPNGTVFFAADNVPFGPGAFAWVKKETLQEPEPVKFRGRSCFHYRTEQKLSLPSFGTGKPNATNEGHSGTVVYEAWIDSETLLPVAMRSGIYVGAFTFHAGPRGPLAIPARFQTPLANAKRRMGLP